MIKWLAVIGLLSPAVFASDLVTSWDWMVSGESSVPSDSVAYFSSERSAESSLNAMLDLELTYQQWLGLVAVKSSDIYHSAPSQGAHLGGDVKSELIIRELFWQGSLELGGNQIDVSAGKMRLDWGVGYGYRPLDLFKPYRRNPIGIQVEEGAGVLSFSHFDATGEWTLLATDSSWTSQSSNELEQAVKQQGVGARRYGLSGDSEYQLIAYYDDVRKGLLGGSWVTVMDAAWEFHASALYQRKYTHYSLPDELIEASKLTTRYNGWQALLGLTWASENGHSLILEYWYDSRAWSRSTWQNSHRRSETLQQNLTLAPLRYSYANGYQNANIVQHNMMLHWSFDSSGWANYGLSQEALTSLTPMMDVLYAPGDGGVIMTPKLSYEWYDSGSSQFETELAARFLTGKEASAYQNLPDKYMILLNLKGRF